MLSESNFTQRLLNALRSSGEFEIIFKLNDRTTSGLPDFIVWRKGIATCYEIKLIGARSAMFKPLQLETLKRIGGRYIIHDPRANLSRTFPAADYERWSETPLLDFNKLVEKIRSTA